MWRNTDQKNSQYGHILRSADQEQFLWNHDNYIQIKSYGIPILRNLFKILKNPFLQDIRDNEMIFK